MNKNKQIQEAGENSQQIMANTVVVCNGYSIEQVKEIINQEISKTLEHNEFVALEIAEERLHHFGDILLPKLVKSEILDAFKEPAIQILFRNAQKTAVCSERKLDYELLSELLIHRAKKNNINENAAISHAIEIIDKITEEALLALTIFYSVMNVYPITGNINHGFQALDEHFGKIMNSSTLPDSEDWIDNLEMNRLISIYPFIKKQKLADYWFNKFSSYSKIWIKIDTNDYQKIEKDFTVNNIPIDLLIDNPLDTNYKTINIVNENMIDNKFSLENQRRVIKEIFHNPNFKSNGNNNEKELFENKLNEFKNLKKINDWWNKIEYSFKFTGIGNVIAETNVKNIDNKLQS